MAPASSEPGTSRVVRSAVAQHWPGSLALCPSKIPTAPCSHIHETVSTDCESRLRPTPSFSFADVNMFKTGSSQYQTSAGALRMCASGRERGLHSKKERNFGHKTSLKKLASAR